MKLILILLISIGLNSDKIYNRIVLSDITIELSQDISNKCVSNVLVKNNTINKIEYQILVFRGDFWYFRHKLKLEPNEVKYYNDAFINCDNKSELSIELIRLNK